MVWYGKVGYVYVDGNECGYGGVYGFWLWVWLGSH